jgi:DNA-binding CsgD family transcriptional regulator
MKARDPDIARSAFDTVAAAQTAGTIAELNDLMAGSIEALGFNVFVGFNLLDAGGVLNFAVMFGRTHEAWERRYMEQSYFRGDPICRELVTTSEPLFWSDVIGRGPLEPAETLMFQEAAEHGLTDGFVTPIKGLDGSLWGVLLAGSEADAADPDTRAAAHLLSLYYSSLAQRIRRAEQQRLAEPLQLSRRQVECLKWVRQGRSSNDIGDLLGLSGRTVDHYLADACRRLGVRTRHQAVIDAALRGVLQL